MKENDVVTLLRPGSVATWKGYSQWMWDGPDEFFHEVNGSMFLGDRFTVLGRCTRDELEGWVLVLNHRTVTISWIRVMLDIEPTVCEIAVFHGG